MSIISKTISMALPKTLFGRFSLILITPLILLQIISGWVFYDRHWETISWRFSTQLVGDIAFILDELRDRPDDRDYIFAQADNYFGLKIQIDDAQIINNDQSKFDSVEDKLLARAINERIKRPFRIDSTNLKEQVILYLQLKEGVMEIAVPGKRLFSSTTYIFMLWMVGSSLILLAIAIYFLDKQIRPIRRLAVAVDMFGKGRDDGQDFKPRGASEIRQAAQAFNSMRARVRDFVKQRTAMLAGVSHDLRTPLTRMKLLLELVEEDSDTTKRLQKNVSEMQGMIQGYLSFVRGEGTESLVELDISQTLENIVVDWRETNNKIVDCHIENKIILPIRPMVMRRAIDNLIGNAHRYADQVWIKLARRKDTVEITIDDDGPGIPENQYEQAFQPFQRLEESRNRETGGTGLGLSIARDICQAHGGGIRLSASPHNGLRATIFLPI